MTVVEILLSAVLPALGVLCPGAIYLGRAVRKARAHRALVEKDLSTLRTLVADLPAIRDVVVGTPVDLIRGRHATPGVAERFDRIERITRQLEPNGGGHIADVVRRTETKVDVLGQRVTDHLANHPGPGASKHDESEKT